jgi:hypothetical protein
MVTEILSGNGENLPRRTLKVVMDAIGLHTQMRAGMDLSIDANLCAYEERRIVKIYLTALRYGDRVCAIQEA